jgi:nucleoside-diphosphate-sugar epimerase
MMFTVLGASGFIGSHLVTHLSASGIECFAPQPGDPGVFQREVGHVVYCVGLTADFRTRPLETVDAHVCQLREILERARFDSLLYLSSTRVYRGAGDTREDAPLRVDPSDPDDLYNMSKIMGESLCLCSDRPHARVARMSNVYGPDVSSENFLATVLRDALNTGRVVVNTAPTSAKDYIGVHDVVPALIRIAEAGRHRVYNVASGQNVTHAELLEGIRTLTGCRVEFTKGAPEVVFPAISTDRMRQEFGFVPDHVMDRLESLVRQQRERLENP